MQPLLFAPKEDVKEAAALTQCQRVEEQRVTGLGDEVDLLEALERQLHALRLRALLVADADCKCSSVLEASEEGTKGAAAATVVDAAEVVGALQHLDAAVGHGLAVDGEVGRHHVRREEEILVPVSVVLRSRKDIMVF